jgi:hypothetical protein
MTTCGGEIHSTFLCQPIRELKQMKTVKKLLFPILAAAMLSSGGSAMALSQANTSAFYANNQISFAHGIAGNKALAGYFCENFLTMGLPDPNEPDVPAARANLRIMCLNWVRSLPNRGGGYNGVGPFTVLTW